MNATGRSVVCSVEHGLATLRLDREHGNAINRLLLTDLLKALDYVEGRADVRGILLASSGKLFCPGLDLQELLDYDRPAMAELMRSFSTCLVRLWTTPKPVVAALHGHALAGGFVLALTADWRVLSGGALIGLNEVRVGVPLPFGVSQILRETVQGSELEAVALLGRNYSGEQALQAGLVDELAETPQVEERALARLAEFAEKDPRCVAITKRHLRWAAAERIREGEGRHLDEFLNCWFAPETRYRIEQIVSTLSSAS